MRMPFVCAECGARTWRNVMEPIVFADVFRLPCFRCGNAWSVDPDVLAWDFPPAALEALAALEAPAEADAQ